MTTAVDDFIADGFIAVRGAVASEGVRHCVQSIEKELRARGVDPHDPLTGRSRSSAWHVRKALRSRPPALHPRSARCTTSFSAPAAGFGGTASAERFRFAFRA